jgi:serine protease AprX
VDEKLLVTIRTDAEVEGIRQSGAEILAAYRHSRLVRATADQRETLERAGLEAAPLGQPSIRLSGASFTFEAALAAEIAAPTAPDPSRPAYYLVRLIGPAKGEWLAALRTNGTTIHASLPGFGLLAGLLPDRRAAIEALPWVEAVTPYLAAMKVSPRLRSGATRALEALDLATVSFTTDDPEADEQVEISVFPGESTAEVAAKVRDAGGAVLAEMPQEVIAVVSRKTIAPLAEQSAAQAILPYAPPHLSNDRTAPILGVPADRLFGELALTGAGQIVAVADTGLDTGDLATLHPDLRDRVVDVVRCPFKPGYLEYVDGPSLFDDSPADVGSGHGTHVAGSVLGNGNAAAASGATTVPRGIAPDAQLYFQALELGVRWKSLEALEAEGRRPFQRSWPPTPFGLYAAPDDLNELFEPAYAAGARIHTNAWGGIRASALGSYNAMARAVDAFLWGHRDMLILFSAGNTCANSDQEGQDHDIVERDAIGPPGTAKNCLTVGASEGDRRLDMRGLTDDLRIKPDVVAPGTNILSLRSSAHDNPDAPSILGGDLPADHPLHGLYCWSSGSSMATPLVAGAAALVRQYLVQEHGHVLGGAKPSGALMKALLVNGAAAPPRQLDGKSPPGPSLAAGFGLVDVKAALGLDGALPVYFSDESALAVETGETRTIELEAVDLGVPLKVTLVWTDAPSLANLGGLQNALYLQVCDPHGEVLAGDVTPYPTATNNVQQVVIPDPVAGTYEVRVRGVSVIAALPGTSPDQSPCQDFALAASNARAATRTGAARQRPPSFGLASQD